MHREMGQRSMAKVLLPGSLGQNRRLERIDQAADREPMRELVARVYSAKEGDPSYPPLLMVKALLLQQWYNLPDPQMEEALILDHSSNTPDATQPPTRMSLP